MLRILFQGDSVTDAGRDKSNPNDLGPGYPHYAAQALEKQFPDQKFQFINRGVSGDETGNLSARLNQDILDVHADIVSILIGVNDVWHYIDANNGPSDVEFEQNLRFVLSAIRNSGTKILLIEPFVCSDDKLRFYISLFPKILILRKLAAEYADAYLPLDGLVAKRWIEKPDEPVADDGVHPNSSGSRFIGKLCADAIAQIIGTLQ